MYTAEEREKLRERIAGATAALAQRQPRHNQRKNIENIPMTKTHTGLTFNALRAANKARIPEFKNRLGQPAHRVPDGSDWSPAQWLQALTGELGEYANFRKKFERGDIDEETFKREAAKELGDVMAYLDILAMQLGIDLGQATQDKFNESSERAGCSIRLTGHGWHMASESLVSGKPGKNEQKFATTKKVFAWRPIPRRVWIAPSFKDNGYYWLRQVTLTFTLKGWVAFSCENDKTTGRN